MTSAPCTGKYHSFYNQHTEKSNTTHGTDHILALVRTKTSYTKTSVLALLGRSLYCGVMVFILMWSQSERFHCTGNIYIYIVKFCTKLPGADYKHLLNKRNAPRSTFLTAEKAGPNLSSRRRHREIHSGRLDFMLGRRYR